MADIRPGVDVTTIREAVIKYRGARRKIESVIQGPVDVARFIRSLVGNDAREHFVCIYLNGRHRPIAYQVVSIGTATASLVHPREVYQPAVGLGACAIIVAHNHPSGDSKPSQEDLEITARLFKAGELLAIPLVDSIVVTESGYVSIREENPDALKAA